MIAVRDDSVTTTIHLSGPVIAYEARVRQRCAWCGFVICDDDLTRMAFPVEPCSRCGVAYSEETAEGECIQGDSVQFGTSHDFAMPDPPKGFVEGAFLEITLDPGGFRGTSVVEPEPSETEGSVKVPENCCMRLPAELTGEKT